MNEKPRQILKGLTAQYGLSLCENPARCKGLLKDQCSDCQLEINILVTALEEHINETLLHMSKGAPYEFLSKQLVKRLKDTRGLDEEYAQWAVDAWAEALGVYQPPQHLGPTSSSGNTTRSGASNVQTVSPSFHQQGELLTHPKTSPTPPPTFSPQLAKPPVVQATAAPLYRSADTNASFSSSPPNNGQKSSIDIAIIIFGCLLIVILIIIIVASVVSKRQSPSGISIDSAAASNVTNIQTAAGVDSNYMPIDVTSTFSANQTVYVTFSTPYGATPGYVETKWYSNGTLVSTGSPLAVISNFFGYFSYTFTSSGSYAVEVYYCTQPDCSDAALAGYTNFTISSISYHFDGQSTIGVLTVKRPTNVRSRLKAR